MGSVFHRRVEGLSSDGEYEVLEREDGSPVGSSDRTPLLPGSSNEMAAPKDRYSFAYLIFYLLGLGSLLPWNFFITASDYWMYKLRNVSETVPDGTIVPPTFLANFTTVSPEENATSTTPANDQITVTSLQALFMNSLAICAMLPTCIFQFLNTLLQKRIPQNVRILSSLALMIFLFIFTEILVRVDTSTWQDTFFTITLISVVFINSCSAILQSSVFGLAACFPQKYSGGVMAGQGMGGVFAALAMIISLAFSNNPTDSAFAFFFVAIVVLILTMMFYILLTKLEFYKFFSSAQRSERGADEKELPLQTPSDSDVPEEKHFLTPQGINSGGDWEVQDASNEKQYSGTSNSFQGGVVEIRESSIFSIAKKIWLHMFCVAYNFFITLSCFPAVTAKIKSSSTGSSWSDVYFTPVCCFLLFNLGDWIGRTSASYIHVPSAENKIVLVIGTLARSVFPFLFALCNYQPRPNDTSVIFDRDFYFIIFMVIFALSNGHLSTLCMQYGPKQVDLENAATAGSMLSFMISVGLLSGAGMSFVVVSLI